MTSTRWLAMKHWWLFLNSLNTVEDVATLVAFYVGQHNSVMPHWAFKGQTPDEMYFGTGAAIPEQLAGARQAAREARIATNRKLRCPSCGPPPDQPTAVEVPEIPPDPLLAQLRTPDSRLL